MRLSLAKTGCKPFKRQPHRVVKHTQTISQVLLKICLSLYDLMMISRLAPLTTTPSPCLNFFVSGLAASRPGPPLEIEAWTGCGREGGPAD